MAILDDIKAGYKLDGNSNDCVGSKNGTDSNISYGAGKIGDCAVFDGSSSRILIDDHADVSPVGDFSISAWVNSDSVSNFRRGICGKYRGDSTGRSFYWGIKQSDGVCTLAVYSSGTVGVEKTIDIGDMTAGTWYHFVIAFDLSAGSAELFVNNVSKGTMTGFSTAGVYDSTAKVAIGDFGEAEGNWWDGKIDEIYLWFKCLTTDEIAVLYNDGAGRTHPFTTVSGPAKLKTKNTLVTAKIKTINGLAIAKIKTINSLV